jgi:hypothetical protein
MYVKLLVINKTGRFSDSLAAGRYNYKSDCTPVNLFSAFFAFYVFISELSRWK